MRLAYLATAYASVCDPFRRGEVGELRARGHQVETFSIRRPDEAVSDDEEVRREHAATDYLIPDRVGRIVGAVAIACATQPRTVARAAVLAWRTRPPGVGGVLRAISYLAQAIYVSRRIRKRGLDHLHCALGAASSSVAMLAAELSGVSWSLALHGMRDLLEPQYWCLGAKISHASFTTCVSHFGVSQCMLATPLSAWRRLHVVRVAPSRPFLELATTPPPRAPRLLWIGRMSHEKGLPLLLEAAARVAAFVPDLRLTLVGDGPVRAVVHELAARLGIGDRVVMSGWLATADVLRQIDDARCVVVSSLGEGIPTVVLEALTRERPVVCSCIAGIPELVEDGRSGWLVPPGSVAHLADALRDAATADPTRLAAMGRHGAARVREQHDLRAEVSKLETLLLGIVDHHGDDR